MVRVEHLKTRDTRWYDRQHWEYHTRELDAIWCLLRLLRSASLNLRLEVWPEVVPFLAGLLHALRRLHAYVGPLHFPACNDEQLGCNPIQVSVFHIPKMSKVVAYSDLEAIQVRRCTICSTCVIELNPV